jgi:hypothetical protein
MSDGPEPLDPPEDAQQEEDELLTQEIEDLKHKPRPRLLG